MPARARRSAKGVSAIRDAGADSLAAGARFVVSAPALAATATVGSDTPPRASPADVATDRGAVRVPAANSAARDRAQEQEEDRHEGACAEQATMIGVSPGWGADRVQRGVESREGIVGRREARIARGVCPFQQRTEPRLVRMIVGAGRWSHRHSPHRSARATRRRPVVASPTHADAGVCWRSSSCAASARCAR